ncbi:PP2C family protein-serine/threonine phosphatase [Rhodococcus sp. LW-XY12]|uniref:PP2C family protein-serine/threonine phosphatase n=1 Tax=Rhodococcus sp. LW-XY12 TaxID=2856851 RepID=UPI001C58DE0A|nr:SpoIIE family protein phosphatase [Rhodococcus sp. LW-XY12]QXU52316.1 SpoIIE family protein phosphatase [Rhodococcus sp. LW-XY12]
MTSEASLLPDHLEDERMRDVERLELLDTPHEERFDKITRMACRVFGVPMASVSLMDHDRQWFKSILGLELSEVPRERTVCRTTIARAYERPDDPALVLPDASTDPAFMDIPGIGGEGGIRFYAGYPLFGPAGHPVGTFCIYDTEERNLDPDQLDTFAELAEWTQRELDRSDELDRAAEIQKQLLPRPLSDLPGYEIATVCLPAFVVGGDFYDHYRLREGVVISVADVMGKGLGAAILASGVRSSLRGAGRVLERFGRRPVGVLDTGMALTLGAEHLADDFEHTGTFATSFVAAIEFSTGDVDHADAGHGLAAIRRADGGVEPLEGDGPPLGVFPATTWTSETAHLAPGDMLVVCSDGLLDLLDENSDPAALCRFVSGHPTPEALVAAARALTVNEPPLDDVTVVAIRRNEMS